MAQTPQQTAPATAHKVRENRLRRVAERRGYTLGKTRRRDPLAVDYGLYWLSDAHEFRVQFKGDKLDPWLATLDEIEAFLNRTRPVWMPRGVRAT